MQIEPVRARNQGEHLLEIGAQLSRRCAPCPGSCPSPPGHPPARRRRFRTRPRRPPASSGRTKRSGLSRLQGLLSIDPEFGVTFAGQCVTAFNSLGIHESSVVPCRLTEARPPLGCFILLQWLLGLDNANTPRPFAKEKAPKERMPIAPSANAGLDTTGWRAARDRRLKTQRKNAAFEIWNRQSRIINNCSLEPRNTPKTRKPSIPGKSAPHLQAAAPHFGFRFPSVVSRVSRFPLLNTHQAAV